MTIKIRLLCTISCYCGSYLRITRCTAISKNSVASSSRTTVRVNNNSERTLRKRRRQQYRYSAYYYVTQPVVVVAAVEWNRSKCKYKNRVVQTIVMNNNNRGGDDLEPDVRCLQVRGGGTRYGRSANNNKTAVGRWRRRALVKIHSPVRRARVSLRSERLTLKSLFLRREFVSKRFPSHRHTPIMNSILSTGMLLLCTHVSCRFFEYYLGTITFSSRRGHEFTLPYMPDAASFCENR